MKAMLSVNGVIDLYSRDAAFIAGDLPPHIA